MTEQPYVPASVDPQLASAADREPIAGVLARAFYDDPVWGWACPDPERRLEQLHALWGVLSGAAIPHESVWTAPGCAAVSVWIPPGKPELGAEDEDRLVAVIEDMLGAGAERVFGIFERFEDAHPHDRGDHHYLSLLGTDPAHAGQGLGMGLLAANLARIDAAGGAAFLESTNPANERRYARLGFARCGEFQLPEDGPRVTQMWRDPR